MKAIIAIAGLALFDRWMNQTYGVQPGYAALGMVACCALAWGVFAYCTTVLPGQRARWREIDEERARKREDHLRARWDAWMRAQFPGVIYSRADDFLEVYLGSEEEARRALELIRERAREIGITFSEVHCYYPVSFDQPKAA